MSFTALILRKNKQPHVTLAISIIAVFGILVSGSFLLSLHEATAQAYVASIPPLFFSLVVLTYWYQRSLTCEKTWHFSSLDYKHLTLPCVALLFGLSVLLMPYTDFNALFFEEPVELSLWSQVNAIGFGLITLVWIITSGFYLTSIIKNVRNYHRRIKDMYANHDNIKLYWLIFFVLLLIFTWAYGCIVLLVENRFSGYGISESGMSVFTLCLIWFFCTHALLRNPSLANIGGKSKEQYQNSAIDANRLERISRKIAQAVIEEKAYLDPDINAVKLAQTLSVSPHYLSQTFSQKMNTTFYDYINAARINAAKIELKQTKKTVLDVAIQVGFNTRSSFYTAFKKNTGMTPSAFRRAI